MRDRAEIEEGDRSLVRKISRERDRQNQLREREREKKSWWNEFYFHIR